ncbi:hypothetical protein [Pedobacter sp. HMWF019]|uniref:hypothetical protein n=1 Tax=Pedobacter sp. HMWF019 TaxID=2056856 RepID=UPI001304E3BA|nr:hypothetical protein [Pedobacter sp. HMWF019]
MSKIKILLVLSFALVVYSLLTLIKTGFSLSNIAIFAGSALLTAYILLNKRINKP